MLTDRQIQTGTESGVHLRSRLSALRWTSDLNFSSRSDVILQHYDNIDELKEDWRAVAEQSRNVFSTWEWASVWWKHFGRERPLLVTVCRERSSGRPVAVIPLCRTHRLPLRIVKFVGYGPADLLGPISAPQDQDLAYKALAWTLQYGDIGWDIFQGDDLPSGELHPSLHGIVRNVQGCPTIESTDLTWPAYLAGKSHHFRDQLRRRELKLTKNHKVKFRLIETPECLNASMNDIRHLSRTGGQPVALFGPQGEFQREFAALSLKMGWLRWWHMEIDDVLAAAYYGFRFNNIESWYQIGRDPAWNKYSLGFILLAHVTKQALSDGIDEIRLGRGDPHYKMRFATSNPQVQTVALTNGPIGCMLLGALDVERRLHGCLNRHPKLIATLKQTSLKATHRRER